MAGAGRNVPLRMTCILIFRLCLEVPLRLRCFCSDTRSRVVAALRLIKENAISRSILEQRRSKRDVTKSKMDTAIKALEGSKILAPFAGRIARVSVKLRQNIRAASPVIDILGEGGLEASINLPASILAHKKKGEKPADTSYIMLEAAPGRRIPARFKEATLEADASSQTYKITFSFKSPDDLLVLPGMNAIIWIENPAKKKREKGNNKISVPSTAIAVAIDGKQKYVWVVDSRLMTISRRNITIADGVGVQVIVTSGLKSGEMIIAAGVSFLSEGMKVYPWSQ